MRRAVILASVLVVGCAREPRVATVPRGSTAAPVADVLEVTCTRAGAWRSPDLDCERVAGTSAGDPTGGPREEAARIARGVLLAYFGDDVAEDEIEQLCYPDAPGPTYGVVRDGRLLARVRLDAADPGSVFPNGLEHCELDEWGRRDGRPPRTDVMPTGGGP